MGPRTRPTRRTPLLLTGRSLRERPVSRFSTSRGGAAMENPRPEKVAVVEEVKSRFNDSEAVVLTDYRGIDVPGMATLRIALREAGAEYQIYKNTLVRFAAQD